GDAGNGIGPLREAARAATPACPIPRRRGEEAGGRHEARCSRQERPCKMWQRGGEHSETAPLLFCLTERGLRHGCARQGHARSFRRMKISKILSFLCAKSRLAVGCCRSPRKKVGTCAEL